jgi:hypothetical protein
MVGKLLTMGIMGFMGFRGPIIMETSYKFTIMTISFSKATGLGALQWAAWATGGPARLRGRLSLTDSGRESLPFTVRRG